VGVYVEDLTIAAKRLDTFKDFKNTMLKVYKMKHLGELHFILGLEVERDRSKRTLHLRQIQYIKSVLVRFNFDEGGQGSERARCGKRGTERGWYEYLPKLPSS